MVKVYFLLKFLLQNQKITLKGTVENRKRDNFHKYKISENDFRRINALILNKRDVTSTFIQRRLNLRSSRRSIRDYINALGWRYLKSKLVCKIT